MEKNYNHAAAESRTYAMWMDANAFRARVNPDKPPFSIAMPPPNVTGQLHIGHAYDNSLQDILIRAKRLQGYESCWVPGIDHAGIATQARVEKMLREEHGVTRHDLGREKFLEHVWAWKEQYGGRIFEQFKSLGVSCDWERQRFTMDEGCSRAVVEAFVKLYEKGLIYKGLRIINWCPKCETALANDEVEHNDREGNLWHIKYPVKGTDEYLIVATTRPETMLGDMAVAVHPEDERYTHLVGKMVVLPLVGREIPVIADEYVDREFGTGCVKITPSHDPNDFDVAQRHGLAQLIVLDGQAVVNENGGQYQGLARYDARKKMLADLEAAGLLAKTEKRTHAVGSCYRCKDTVEPLASEQWFVKMEPLAKKAIDVVKNGKMAFEPERFTKIYLHWMENIRDWCISRQLWWGHRIPAYTCAACDELVVARAVPKECQKCGQNDWQQDSDVLDTWFSAALWPFEVFGWPEKTSDLAYFYPTMVVNPAYDIIFFWVARMIVMGLEFMGDVPFKTAFIHGLVRAEDGRKISKSLDNGVDVVEMVQKYGADSLRLALTIGVGNGNDLRFSDEKCESMRNFGNKLWNAARFVLSNDVELSESSLPDTLQQEDKWILNRLHTTVQNVTAAIDRYDLGMAAQMMVDFVWNEFCDWYIELSKPRVFAHEQDVQRVLTYVLSKILTLLHPFMPFITEEIWQSLPHKPCDLLVRGTWPQADGNAPYAAETAAMERVMEAIRAIRAKRAEMNIPPSKKTALMIVTDELVAYDAGQAVLCRLASGSEVSVTNVKPSDLTGYVQVMTQEALILLPLDQLVDREAEIKRLQAEKVKVEKELAPLQARLNNEGFIAKAPPNVVAADREKEASLMAKLAKITEGLGSL
ncbi:MAG: valine--tRNA ligase [Oscillospiraceae bacterium]|nr:valine--tRNA ligase [Oscillospiraceae bacterium]